MCGQMRKKFRKSITALEDITKFVAEFARRHRVNQEFTNSINLAIEEIFVNMVQHNPETKDDILISIDIEGKMLAICLADRDRHSFDVTEFEAVELRKPIHERRGGGMGLHLVKSLMDDVKYEYADGYSRIWMFKQLEN